MLSMESKPVRFLIDHPLTRAFRKTALGRRLESAAAVRLACDPNPDRERLNGLRDRHRGERCFIIGNGPSLNETDLGLLADEYTIAVNGIFYKYDEIGFKSTFFVVEDRHVVNDNLDRINEIDYSIKFFPSRYAKTVRKTADTYFLPTDFQFYDPACPNFEVPRFSTDAAEVIYAGQTVTYLNFQLAYHLGFTEVYLIGVDFSYTIPETALVDGATITSVEDDPNHFHPDYFGEGKKWHDPKLHNCLKVFEEAKRAYEADGRKIYNATVGGKLELFDRVDYASLF